MDLAELEAQLVAQDPSTLLVSPRVLRRVVKRHLRLPGLGLDVPHAFVYAIDKSALFDLVDGADLGAAAASAAGDVILVPRPEAHERASFEDVVLRVWRARFHASVHRALEARLSPALARARARAIGQTEIDEAREVLRQERSMLPPNDATSAYAEFAATYLELRAFAPRAVARTFPALADHEAVDAVLALDVDTRALVARCRPPGAPPLAELLAGRAEAGPTAPSSRPPREPRVVESVSPPPAGSAPAENVVRAILLAAAAGPSPDLDRLLSALVVRVARALGDAPDAAWQSALRPLALAAARRRLSVEARLLYDLQSACVDRERASFTIDAVTWARTLGRRPLVRDLPLLREHRLLRRLRAAHAKAARAALDPDARTRLLELTRAWEARAERRLRAIVRPRILATLEATGPAPESVPEKVARDKLALELEDTIALRGFLSLGQLRDAFSRSDLKMRNVTAGDLVSGGALLRTDALLAESLDGIYRRGEIYLRALARASSVPFGTRLGRLLTLYVILPFGAAYVGLQGLQHVVGPIMEYVLRLPEPRLYTPASLVVAGLWIFGLLHVPIVRKVTALAFRALGLALRAAFFDVPRLVWRLSLVQRVVTSAPVVLAGRYLVKPLVLALLLWPVAHALPLAFHVQLAISAALFLATSLFLATKLGVRAEEAAIDFAVDQWRMVHQRVLPGIVALFADVFRRFLDAIDRGIYAVDEYLRFHRSDGAARRAVKGVLGSVWYFVRYVVRIYVNLLIEPQVNPIKHFPVVTVAAKIILPFHRRISRALAGVLARVIAPRVARAFASPTVVLLPGFFGFVVWELKENWKLYAQNRPPALGPVAIGHHGETMAGYLVRGFHSGTIPKLWAKIRRAARKGGDAAKARHELRHVEETIERFVERTLLAILAASARWTHGPIEVTKVAIASNRVRVSLGCHALAEAGEAWIDFEEQSRWLVAGIARAGFLDALDAGGRAAFEDALAGLYKAAAVDLVREQIAACLTEGQGDAPPYDVADEGLVVWPDGGYANEVVYDLARPVAGVPLPVRARGAALPARPVRPEALFFRDQPVLWTAWTHAWSSGDGAARVFHGPPLLPPPKARLSSSAA